MVLTFVWPSDNNRSGGTTVIYELANAFARRGHDVHFVHGPWTPFRVSGPDQLDCFHFHESITHHFPDTLDDPGLPPGDVVLDTGFHGQSPAYMGLACRIVQGYGVFGPRLEHGIFRTRVPKLCVSHWLTDVGRALGVPAEQLWHVPCGLDHELFNVADPSTERTIDIAVLCHWLSQKGWGVARATLFELHSRRPDLSTVVFGTNRPRQELPKGTQFLESPTHRQLVDEVYQLTRVFLQASRTEGFGLTPVEAMSCGAALVTTDTGGSREYGFHDETALVTGSEDVTELADAVERLLDDDELRIRLASAGRAYCRRFDWGRSAEILEKNLESYLADPARYQQTPAEISHPAET